MLRLHPKNGYGMIFFGYKSPHKLLYDCTYANRNLNSVHTIRRGLFTSTGCHTKQKKNVWNKINFKFDSTIIVFFCCCCCCVFLSNCIPRTVLVFLGEDTGRICKFNSSTLYPHFYLNWCSIFGYKIPYFQVQNLSFWDTKSLPNVSCKPNHFWSAKLPSVISLPSENKPIKKALWTNTSAGEPRAYYWNFVVFSVSACGKGKHEFWNLFLFVWLLLLCVVWVQLACFVIDNVTGWRTC